MRFTPTAIADVVLVDPQVHHDPRGYFFEVYRADKFAAGGIDAIFVQDNQSRSPRHTLRGLHAQLTKPQGKLLRVLEGSILDIAADVRVGSPTFGQHVAVELSADNRHMLWVPSGFVHGFCVLSDDAAIEYKCTALYDPTDEYAVIWNDPDLHIPWPTDAPLLSAKDQAAPTLATLQAQGRLPVYRR